MQDTVLSRAACSGRAWGLGSVPGAKSGTPLVRFSHPVLQVEQWVLVSYHLLPH